MSTIDTWKVKAYGANVMHVAQQKGSIFQQFCKPESFTGVSKYFDILGSTEAIDRTSRNPATPNLELAHTRRMLTLKHKHWGTMVDEIDKLQMIHNPDSEYLAAAVNAFGRTKDSLFVDAFIASAYEDVDGGTPVAFPNAQKRMAVASSAATNLNLATILEVKQTFDEADIDPDLPRYWAISPAVLKGLLNVTQITNVDYANVKALVEGKVDTFCGFKFIQSNKLKSGVVSGFQYFNTDGSYKGSSGVDASSDSRLTYAWVGNDAMLCGMGTDMKVEAGPRADLSYDNQIYIRMSLGFMRMEDVRCQAIVCKEA